MNYNYLEIKVTENYSDYWVVTTGILLAVHVCHIVGQATVPKWNASAATVAIIVSVYRTRINRATISSMVFHPGIPQAPEKYHKQ